MPRKNGTMTTREQEKALAVIKRDMDVVREALQLFARTHAGDESAPVSEAMQTAWNALHDAETALSFEHRRVWLNTPQSAIDRMMENVD